MSGKNMKAWIVREKNEFCAAVVFAQTRGKAKVLAMQTDACDGADFMDIEVHRAKEADKYYQDGKTLLDWDNDADKIVLVKECGFVCDIDFFEILVFNNTILDTFTGKRIELPQYQQEYSESEFEVITETYNWGHAVFQGWLWTEGNPVHCIMNIYFKGDMVYVVE